MITPHHHQSFTPPTLPTPHSHLSLAPCDWMTGCQVTGLTDEACSWVMLVGSGASRWCQPSWCQHGLTGLMRETATSAFPLQSQESVDKSAVHHEPCTNDMLTNADISLLIDTKRQRWSSCQGFWGDNDKTRWDERHGERGRAGRGQER